MMTSGICLYSFIFTSVSFTFSSQFGVGCWWSGCMVNILILIWFLEKFYVLYQQRTFTSSVSWSVITKELRMCYIGDVCFLLYWETEVKCMYVASFLSENNHSEPWFSLSAQDTVYYLFTGFCFWLISPSASLQKTVVIEVSLQYLSGFTRNSKELQWPCLSVTKIFNIRSNITTERNT